MIGCVVALLVAALGALLVKQKQMRIRQIENDYAESSHSHSHGLRRTANFDVQIESTLSLHAPCKEWMICDELGSGRFGQVRLAIDPGTELAQQIAATESVGSIERLSLERMEAATSPRYYAVKRAAFGVNMASDQRISRRVASDEVMSILHEIDIISRLRHPNIVRYFGNGAANGHICLFLEWLPVGSMGDILKVRKSFSVMRIHHFLSNLLSALDFMHSRQIFHRDIKSRNILLCKNGSCKLCDFGSAVMVDRRRRCGQSSVAVAGTVHWMPPETFAHREQSLNFECVSGHDVWSLGVTTIEMINGCPPYYQLSAEVLGVLMRTAPSTYTQTQLPITSDLHLNAFLRACLAVSCAHRPTIKQLLRNPFIVRGPRCNNVIAANTKSNNATPNNDLSISAFLNLRDSEAQKYASDVMRANLHLWKG